MRPSLLLMLAAGLWASACTKGSDASRQVTRSIGTVLFPKKEDALVTTLQKRQEANLVRLAQQRAMEQAAAEQAATELAAAERAYKRKKSGRGRKVPPSMYRTAEPPLPEPDLSLPIQEIPRSGARDN